MDWLWTTFGQRPRLESWERRPFTAGVEKGPHPGDHRDCHERVVALEEPGPPAAGGPYRRLATAILAFQVFPPRTVTGVIRQAPVEVGDVAGVWYHPAPGLTLFFASRVIARFDGPTDGVWRTGFTYRTLAGHPECGEETFCVEKDLRTGRIVVALRSWSRPAIFLARALAPLTRWLQLQAGRSALDHLGRLARNDQGEPYGCVR
jgi:uncharacterized protein (UPF0548 family)